jgi:uncharacterized protein
MFKKYLLAASIAFALAPASDNPAIAASPASTAQADADPAVWVVRDDDTTIYLFGTFHMLDERPWFNDEVKTAFDSSDELVLEAVLPENPADLQPLIMRYAVDPNGRKLSERLTAEQNATLGQALASLGAPAAAFDQFEPWFVSLTMVTVAAQKLGASAENGPETVLSKAARERQIPVSELEGFEWQMRLFDGLPEEQQIAQLRQTIDLLDEMDESMAPMLAAWSTGNVQQMVDMLKEHQAQDPVLHEVLFENRNRSWAEWVDDRLDRPGTVFVAVGVGHLTGEDSVQNFLATRGIRSERLAPQTSAQPTP